MYEETGYDIANLAESDAFIEGVLNYQYTRLYLIRNVPIETIFVPRTRKEIKCCEWFSIDHLPTHKTDPVSRNHLGINANSFFMIMPFVKRLKKWINEQNHLCQSRPLLLANGQSLKKSKGDNKNGGSNSSSNGIVAAQQNAQGGANSPRSVFFKNNAGPRRQRHKSMGDLDSSNVVTHESVGSDTSVNSTGNNQTASMHGHTPNQNSTKPQHQPTAQISGGGKRSIDNNNTNNLDGNVKILSGKRKLFSATATDQTNQKRAPSPLIDSNIQQSLRQPHQQQLKNSNKILNNNITQNSSNMNGKQDNKKKKNTKNWATDLNINAATTTNNNVSSVDQQMLMSSNGQSENEHPSNWVPIQWRNIFNPPPLTQLLRNEPSINKWRNVRLNKDIIMSESLKILF